MFSVLKVHRCSITSSAKLNSGEFGKNSINLVIRLKYLINFSRTDSKILDKHFQKFKIQYDWADLLLMYTLGVYILTFIPLFMFKEN